ncbi:uncharacterized protein MELLADRAFT_62195 [Melampsora larici-populina 98AG31]|uniref:Secreted protein n=1 Tax=Melampsora larici-populina (strain 98AG31 / pathotype 3-4-7) TaxID=747676 RepID=F4RHY3_MELLP|nr:uncharacterized protein MELLADRAFT_62195 [Melampsora larici-populina 98AG31]EGG08051.1 secreted protein [Melampsora larici-populina 98AG31]
MLITYLSAIFIYAQLAHSSSINPQTASEHRLQPRDTQNANVLSEGVLLHKRANEVADYIPNIISGSDDGDDWENPGRPRSKRSIDKKIVTEDPGKPGIWGRYRVKRGIKTEMIGGDHDGLIGRRDRVKREYKPDMISGDVDGHWRRVRVKRAISTNTISGSAQ